MLLPSALQAAGHFGLLQSPRPASSGTFSVGGQNPSIGPPSETAKNFQTKLSQLTRLWSLPRRHAKGLLSVLQSALHRLVWLQFTKVRRVPADVASPTAESGSKAATHSPTKPASEEASTSTAAAAPSSVRWSDFAVDLDDPESMGYSALLLALSLLWLYLHQVRAARRRHGAQQFEN